MPKKTPKVKSIEQYKHVESRRKNIPSAEQQSIVPPQVERVRKSRYPRNTDLDPQLVWRGKDEQDWSDLVVPVPPIYIQEKVHPKALIDDVAGQTKAAAVQAQVDLFSDFNGIPKGADKTEFYQHDQNWSNRMILGDSLQVMASLAEREGLRGRVQCIYFDPPYGIRFNSNFQWSTTSRDVKDGNAAHITREPEQVKAFRDTWREGIHSYLTYLRDRLTIARDLLAESGSIFVQIGDENVHRVRALMDEVFGEANFASQISVNKTSGLGANLLAGTQDFVLWYARNREAVKFRRLYTDKMERAGADSHYQEDAHGRLFTLSDLTAQNNNVQSCIYTFPFNGAGYPTPGGRQWKTTFAGMTRLARAGRVQASGRSIRYKRYVSDLAVLPITDVWSDIGGSVQSRNDPKIYVVQTGTSVIQRCVLMTTDPGDLVLDPTCGSGTTATVAEEWGRRWITIDTSRVALALARARIMGTRYPYYLLADSREGQKKEAEVTQRATSTQPVYGNIRHGFVYERVPLVSLQSFSKNVEIDVIWEKWQPTLESLREKLNAEIKRTLQEWEIPREPEEPWDDKTREIFYKIKAEQERGDVNRKRVADALEAINRNLKRNYTLETLPERPADRWPELPSKLHAEWWQARIARQQEIDKSIATKADFEYLYDKPYEDKKTVRVAGPFTVESLSPHRTLDLDENDNLIDRVRETSDEYGAKQTFEQIILENLKVAGVQQAHKADRITFTALAPWPGTLVCAEGRYMESDAERRAAIFVGPEFGTVQRADLAAAAREAGDAGFDVLIACAFNYEAHTTEFTKLGRLPVLKARMNADLHMAEDLKTTKKGNLFVVFGEPDIELTPDSHGQLRVKVKGVDVFKPQTGEVVSDGADGIACWFIDTDYNEESFFVRHAYFLGANDPYSALKTTLKAEIDRDAWQSLHSDKSRPFRKPKSGRIAVKVINHLGDEVMKVFRV